MLYKKRESEDDIHKHVLLADEDLIFLYKIHKFCAPIACELDLTSQPVPYSSTIVAGDELAGVRVLGLGAP